MNSPIDNEHFSKLTLTVS